MSGPCETGDEFELQEKEEYTDGRRRESSIQPEQRRALPECSWEELGEPEHMWKKDQVIFTRFPEEALVRARLR